MISELAKSFLKEFHPDANIEDWQNWRWQMRKRYQCIEDISQVLSLSEQERIALTDNKRAFPVSITPHMMAMIDRLNSDDPLRRTLIPVPDEFLISKGEYSDPLGEDKHSPFPGLVHKYPDRVLFLMTDHCPVYCRYCTRSRLVGGNADFTSTKKQWLRSIQYIKDNQNIHDVLISGGDPFIFSDDKIIWLLEQLQGIKHLDYIRIGTKIPVSLPQRFTNELIERLKRFHPLYLSIHINHSAELAEESLHCLNRLADAGLPMGSQTVLLKGINDEPETIQSLMRLLIKNRVKPYYLLQCDPIAGSAHFKTSVQTGLDIMHYLRGRTSGYAIPQLILDVPEGGGKIPLVPEYIKGRDGDDLLIENYQGKAGFRYHDPI